MQARLFHRRLSPAAIGGLLQVIQRGAKDELKK